MTYGEGEYGTGKYGGTTTPPPPTANPLNLRVSKKTTTIVTLQWDSQTGVSGYYLNKNGNTISQSWDSKKTTWRASYVKGDKFEVIPVKDAASSEIVM